MEAQEIKFNYLTRLFIVYDSVDRFSINQKKITECLDLYSKCLDREHTYNISSSLVVRTLAKEALMSYAPTVRELEPLVNRWLAKGQPLNL